MWLPKSLVLAVALVVGASGLTQAAARRDRSASAYNKYGSSGAQYPATPPAAPGSYGGYSTDPHTRALQALADKYRPGW